MQISKIFEEYVDECVYVKRLRPETIRTYKAVFKHFCNIMSEVKDVEEFKADKVTSFFKQLQTRERIVGKGTKKLGIKDSTAKTYWTKLDAFCKWMIEKDYIDRSPMGKRPSAPIYADKRALTKEEIGKLYAAVSLHSPNAFLLKRNTAILSTFLFTGVRKGELLGIKVADVDFSKREITVRGETSKSKVTRFVPMSATLVLHMQDYISERKRRNHKDEFFFTSNNEDEEFTKHGLIHLVRELVKKSGVKFHVHRFRHTFACALGRSGASAVKIQKLLGHKSLRMTDVYLRSMGVEDYRDVVDTLSIESFM